MPLSDDQFLNFLADGYLVVTPSKMSDKDHDHLYASAQLLYERSEKLQSRTAHFEILGDNLRALIPEVDHVVNDPAVVDTVTSLIGNRYVLHPHHYVHTSTTADQGFHQDGNLPWNERGHYRSHRPDWLFLFYYPQAVDETNGPTEIVAGSQYWTKDFETEDGWRSSDSMDRSFNGEDIRSDNFVYRDRRLQEGLDSVGVPDLDRRFIHVTKGSVVIGSYDLIHRGSRKLLDTPDRFMYKFYAARATEPNAPAWYHKDMPDFAHVRKELQPVVKQIWDWSSGQKSLVPVEDMQGVADRLMSGREDEKVEAAYRLGSDDAKEAIEILIKAVRSKSESTRRASGYGLRNQGQRATLEIVEVLQSSGPKTRRVAAYALGTVESASSQLAVDALIHCVESDDDDLVRSNAAYSLGQLSRANKCDAQRIGGALIARLLPGVEPNNTVMAGLPRSTLRQSVAYALMQLLINHELPDDITADVVRLAVDDPDRYVRGMLLEALSYCFSDNPVAAALTGGLIRQRWNIAPRLT